MTCAAVALCMGHVWMQHNMRDGVDASALLHFIPCNDIHNHPPHPRARLVQVAINNNNNNIIIIILCRRPFTDPVKSEP